MKKEFNLSSKGYEVIVDFKKKPEIRYNQKDIKEAVRLLKEFKDIEHDGSFIAVSVIRERIDKIFGDKLI